MLEQLSLFFLGGGAYAALELAWRGTTHWTMFAAGGACLCLLQKLAAAPLPLAGAAALGAAGVSGLELAVGAVCRSLLHTEVWDYTAEWGNVAGLICPRYSFYWFFALRVGHLCAAGRRKYRLSPSKFPVRQLKSKLSYRLSGILRSYQIRKAVHTMTQQFRYVGGHIEVFSENGEFLFSADTMQEAWEELSA